MPDPANPLAADKVQAQWPELDGEDLDHAHAVVGRRWHRLRDMRLFLTGGTGFVGKWLLATLLDADRRLGLGCEVTVLTRDPEAFRLSAPQLAAAPQVELVCGDVRHLKSGSRPYSHVIHAATDALTTGHAVETFETCVGGTRRALDFALSAGAKEFLLVSSGAIYGRQPPQLLRMREDFPGAPDPLDSGSAYAQGKRGAEWLGSAYAAEHGLQVKTARCFAFVGPYLPLDRHFAVGNFIRAALANRPIDIHGDGTPFRSYLHASDMSAWLWAVLIEGRTQTAYNVGAAEPVSILRLAEMVVQALNSRSTIHVRKPAAAGALAERYVPDVSRIQTELQLDPPWELHEAVLRAARWHQRRSLARKPA